MEDSDKLGDQQFLTFLVAGERFALDILQVKEIINFTTLTHIPMVPVYVRGVLNLRGHGVPVIDLGVRFGNPPCQITRLSCIIIVEISNERGASIDAGILVDGVQEVISIHSTDIEPAPSFGKNARVDFIDGMAKIKDEFVILINIRNFLNIDDFSILQELHAEEKVISEKTRGHSEDDTFYTESVKINTRNVIIEEKSS